MVTTFHALIFFSKYKEAEDKAQIQLPLSMLCFNSGSQNIKRAVKFYWFLITWYIFHVFINFVKKYYSVFVACFCYLKKYIAQFHLFTRKQSFGTVLINQETPSSIKHWRSCFRYFLSTNYFSSKQITHFELSYVLGNLPGLLVTDTLTLSSILRFSRYFIFRLLIQVW